MLINWRNEVLVDPLTLTRSLRTLTEAGYAYAYAYIMESLDMWSTANQGSSHLSQWMDKMG